MAIIATSHLTLKKMNEYFKQPNGLYCKVMSGHIPSFNLTEQDIIDEAVLNAENSAKKNIKEAKGFGNIIAELSRYTENLPRMIETAKSEAVKEFAERLKSTMFNEDFLLCEPCDMANIIDNFVKEMMEDEGK